MFRVSVKCYTIKGILPPFLFVIANSRLKDKRTNNVINPFGSIITRLWYFNLTNARRFYSSRGDFLDRKGLKTISLNPFGPLTDLGILLWLTTDYFTLANARLFYSSRGDFLDKKGLKTISLNPFGPITDLILLWLTPDDFTRQGETSWTGMG